MAHKIPNDLISRSILQFVATEDLTGVLSLCQEVEASKGNFSNRGTPAQDLFVLLEGHATLLGRNQQEILKIIPGRSIELGRVLEGADSWNFTWRCDSECRFLKIPWQRVNSKFTQNPKLFRYLKRVSTNVAIQKLKNDMLAMGISRPVIQEFIGSLKLAPYNEVLGDWSERVFIVINQRGLRMRTEVGDRVFDVAHFRTSDSALLDLPNLMVTFECESEDNVWYMRESSVDSLSQPSEVRRFLEVYLPVDDDDSVNDRTVFHKIQASPISSAAKITGEGHVDGVLARLWRWWTFSSVPAIPVVNNSHSTYMALAVLGQKMGVSVDVDQLLVQNGAQSILGNFQLMEKVAESAGIRIKTVAVSSLEQLSTFPCIVFLYDRAVVISQKSRGRLFVMDFSDGCIKWMPTSHVEANWKRGGVLVPYKKAKTVPQATQGAERIRQLASQNSVAAVTLVLLGTMAYTFMSVGGSVLQGYVIDAAIRDAGADVVSAATGILALSMLIVVIGDFLTSRVIDALATTKTISVFSIMMRLTGRIDVESVHRLGISNVVTRLADISELRTYFRRIFKVPGAIMMLMIGSIILYLMEPGFVGLAVSFFAVQALIVSLGAEPVRRLTQSRASALSAERKIAIEHLNAPEEISSMDLGVAIRWRWDHNLAARMRVTQTLQKIEALISSQNVFTREALKIGILYLGTTYFMSGRVTFGQIIGASLVCSLMANAFATVISSVLGKFESDTFLHRLAILADRRKTSKHRNPETEAPARLTGKIEFKKVSFGFQSQVGQGILRNLNFTIPAGARVCILGDSGAGKSTLAKLMNGLLQPSEGEILFDGIDLFGITKGSVRSRVTLVEQGGDLFAGTIQENITLFSDDPEVNRVVEAAKVANVDEFVVQYPENYGHRLTYLGGGISAGQKQRILLARMVYLNPDVAILDEATSHLDTVTETLVLNNIFDHFEKRTVIVFTQRFNVARQADLVLFLSDGQVVESGTHLDLVAKRGAYFRFFTRFVNSG